MDGWLRRLTPAVLLALALIVWFEKSLPLGSLENTLGETGFLRFVVGMVCLYTMFLVIERQRMEVRFTQVLGSFKKFYEERTQGSATGATGGDVDAVAKSLEAVRILIAALKSPEADVRESAQSNLKRLTGKDFGGDTAAWSSWLAEAERIAAAGDTAPAE